MRQADRRTHVTLISVKSDRQFMSLYVSMHVPRLSTLSLVYILHVCQYVCQWLYVSVLDVCTMWCCVWCQRKRCEDKAEQTRDEPEMKPSVDMTVKTVEKEKKKKTKEVIVWTFVCLRTVFCELIVDCLYTTLSFHSSLAVNLCLCIWYSLCICLVCQWHICLFTVSI